MALTNLLENGGEDPRLGSVRRALAFWRLAGCSPGVLDPMFTPLLDSHSIRFEPRLSASLRIDDEFDQDQTARPPNERVKAVLLAAKLPSPRYFNTIVCVPWDNPSGRNNCA